MAPFGLKHKKLEFSWQRNFTEIAVVIFSEIVCRKSEGFLKFFPFFLLFFAFQNKFQLCHFQYEFISNFSRLQRRENKIDTHRAHLIPTYAPNVKLFCIKSVQ